MIRTLAYRLGQALTWIGGMALLALIAELLAVVPGSPAPWAGLALWRIAVGTLAMTGAGVALWVGCGPETTAEWGPQ